MSERTVEDGYFGSVGMGDPETAYTESTLGVTWDFGKKNVPENKTIPLMMIPKGFLIDRISVVQTKFADQSVGLTFGLKSDTTKAVGGTFTLAASGTLLRSSQSAAAGETVYVASTSAGSPTKSVNVGAGSLFVDAADVLCMIVPDSLTNDKCAEGAFELFIHGFKVFAEAESHGNGTPYRQTLQTAEQAAANVSGGDYPID